MLSEALVVDDDPQVRQLLGAALRRHNIACDFAGDGEEVFEKLQQKSYRVLLLDLMMPYVDGVGVVRQLKESGNRTPVIVISGAPPSMINDLDRTVVHRVFVKPVDVNEVADAILSLRH